MSSSSLTTTSNRQHETQVPLIIAMVIVCPAISGIFVAMRIYTRAILAKRYFLEDHFIIVASACTVIMSIFMGTTVLNGNGRHIEFATAAQLVRLRKGGIGTIQFYFLAHFFLKSSILLQYIRVCVMSFERRLCYALIVINSCGYLALTITHLGRCRPFKANWTPNLPGAQCLNSTAGFFAGQIWNILMDFVILLAPLFILRHMTIPRRQRVLFGVVLAFGGLASIIAAVRFKTLMLSTTSKDPTWDKTPSGFYAQLEVNLGIFCASIVTLRPLFRRLRQLFPGSKSRHVELEGQQQKCQCPIIDPDKSLMSLGSTQVTNDSHSHDVELGGMGKDSSRAGSSISASETVEGAKTRNIRGK